MTSNIVVEEASDNQVDLMEMMKNLQRKMEEIQHKYEKELKSFYVENAAMCRDQSVKNPIPPTTTQLLSTKQREEPCRTIYEGSLEANKDHRPSQQ